MPNIQQFEFMDSPPNPQPNLSEMLRKFLESILKFFAQFQTQTMQINTRQLKIIRKLAEGGFSFVYLVNNR
jgi:hypothetical protein